MFYKSELMEAIDDGDYEQVKMILKYDDINERNDWGFTPLISAARNGCTRIVQLLLYHGAYINCVNDYGFNALSSAATEGHEKVVKELLKYENVNVNQVNEFSYTALISASKAGYANIVKQLLEYKKNDSTFKQMLNSTNSFKNTALHEAVLEGHMDVVELLLIYGSDLLLRNQYGQKPYDIAESKGYMKIAKLLFIVEENARNKSHGSMAK